MSDAVDGAPGSLAARAEERRSPLSARAGAGAGGAQERPRSSSRKGASSSPPTIATNAQRSTSRKGAPRWRKGDLEQAAAKFRHAIQLRPDSSEAQPLPGAGRWRSRGTRPASRLLPNGVGTESGRALRASAASIATTPPGRGRPARVAEFEGYIRGNVQGGRAAARRVRQAAPGIVVGLVRARLQPVRAAEDRSNRSRRWPNLSSSTSATPKPTRSSAAI